MTKIQHLFVIDPIKALNLKLDSSLRIACALSEIGHEVAVCTPQDIFWSSQEGQASCRAQFLCFESFDLSGLRIKDPIIKSLADFQAVHMRKDPPYDMAYIACTWMLDSAHRLGVKVWNSPQALRDFNEKLGIFQFPEFIQPGLVSTRADDFLKFLNENAHGDAVLKPLTLFGGRGVLRLNVAEMNQQQIEQILIEETRHGEEHRLMQPFDRRIFDGEVRAFAVGGKPISWCLKKPHGENFLANTRSGATLEPYVPNQAEIEMITTISHNLNTRGIFYIGFDIIGGKVSEINVTSPRLLHAPSDTTRYYSKIASVIESQLGIN